MMQTVEKVLFKSTVQDAEFRILNSRLTSQGFRFPYLSYFTEKPKAHDHYRKSLKWRNPRKQSRVHFVVQYSHCIANPPKNIFNLLARWVSRAKHRIQNGNFTIVHCLSGELCFFKASLSIVSWREELERPLIRCFKWTKRWSEFCLARQHSSFRFPLSSVLLALPRTNRWSWCLVPPSTMRSNIECPVPVSSVQHFPIDGITSSDRNVLSTLTRLYLYLDTSSRRLVL